MLHRLGWAWSSNNSVCWDWSSSNNTNNEQKDDDDDDDDDMPTSSCISITGLATGPARSHDGAVH